MLDLLAIGHGLLGYVSSCLSLMMFCQERAKIAFNILAPVYQCNRVVELPLLGRADKAVAAGALAVELEEDPQINPRRRLTVVRLADPFVGFPAHAANFQAVNCDSSSIQHSAAGVPGIISERERTLQR